MRSHPRLAALGPLLALMVLPSLGCEANEGDVDLIVILRTDLVPGVEFTNAVTELDVPGTRVVADAVTGDTNYLEPGHEIAVYSGLAPDASRRVRVVLRNSRGMDRGVQDIVVDNRTSIAVPILITRDCADITCPPRPGDPETHCFGGRCVLPECRTGTEPECPEPECITEEQCPPLNDCSSATCVNTVCVYRADDSLCGEREYCDPDTGCLPLPPPQTVLRWPWNGYMTGSALAPRGGGLVSHPATPLFRWEPTIDAESYEIDIDDDCDPTDFRACDFESPVVSAEPTGTTFSPSEPLPISTTQPVGRRYYWRVRACNATGCGPWSEIRYLEVGRLRGDFNGDGRADLAISAQGLQNEQGNCFVYYGMADGGFSPPVRLDNPEDEDGGLFGSDIASPGDLNGDGYSDLAIGARGMNSAAGEVYVFFGGPRGVNGDMFSVRLRNPFGQDGGNFGISVAGPGDVDGDGFADLAVGADRQDSPEPAEGNVYLFLGSGQTFAVEPAAQLDNPFDQPNGRFGRDVAELGDVNGDGYPDLVVGANLQDNPENDEGNAFVFYGGPSGFAGEPGRVVDSVTGQTGGDFGHGFAGGGDVNGDGFADLVIGANQQSSPELEEGNAYLFLGSREGLSEAPAVTLDNPDDEAGGNFGRNFCPLRDLNGDGFADLVVAAIDQDSRGGDNGRVFLYFGSESGIPSEAEQLIDPQPAENGITFGDGIACDDYTGDGYHGISIGAPNFDSDDNDEGAVWVYQVGQDGVVDPGPVYIPSPSNDNNGYFGDSISR